MANFRSNRRQLKTTWGIQFISIVFVLAVGAASCSTSSGGLQTTIPPTGMPTGESERTPPPSAASPTAMDLRGRKILIVQMGNMTGRGSEFILPMVRGVQDAVERANVEDGLFGAELALETYNTSGEAEAARQILFHVQENVRPAVLIFLDAELIAELGSELSELKIPVLLPYAYKEMLAAAAENYIFGLAPPMDVELIYTLQFLQENWEEYKPSLALSELKLAVIGWPNGFGRAGLTDDARKHLEAIRIELVYEDTFNASYAEDASPLLRQAMRAGANVIYVQAFAHGPAIVLNDYYWMGLQDQALVAGPSWALDTSVYGYLTKPEYFDGFLAPSSLAWWSDSENPLMAALTADLEEAHRTPADKSLGRLIGYQAVGVVHFAIRALLEKGGGGDFTGQDLRGELVGLDGVQVLNGLAIISFSGEYQFSPFMQMRRVESAGVFQEISPYTEFSEYP